MSTNIIGLTLSHKDSKRTNRCISSLLDNDVTHVLVWENSADNGKNTSILRQAWKKEPRVSIVESKENLGFAKGVNKGIEWITDNHPNSMVFLINNDAIALPGAIKSLCKTLLANPQALLVFPNIDQNGKISGKIYYHRWLGLLTQKKLPGSFVHPSGCALLLNPSHSKPRLFDEDFFMYGEDVMLGWNFRKTKQLIHAPETAVWHEGSASSHIGSSFYETRMNAAHILLAKKMARNKADYVWLSFGRLLSLTARALVRTLRYKNTTPLTALWSGWYLVHTNTCKNNSNEKQTHQ